MNVMAGNVPRFADFIMGFSPKLIPYYSATLENQIAGDHPNLKDGVWFGRPPRTLGT
jgi:hypothetical protein